MSGNLMGKRVAILAADGFQQDELEDPKRALERQGAVTSVISLKSGEIRGWKNGGWGQPIRVNITVDQAQADLFDALLVPGGVMSPDRLRMNRQAVELVRSFYDAGKPIGAICHGPWMLAEADVIQGCTVTSWPSIRTDLVNAGAEWFDREVICDRGLVTSRNPNDLPAFKDKLIEAIAEGVHQRASHAKIELI